MKNIFYIIIGIIIGMLLFKQTNIDKQKSDKQDKNIKVLVRQTARWAAAAQQDDSPIVALLHANYGAGYLWALRDIASDIEIKESTGVDILDFQKKIVDVQDASTKKVTGNCPEFIGDLDQYLLRIAGDM